MTDYAAALLGQAFRALVARFGGAWVTRATDWRGE